MCAKRIGWSRAQAPGSARSQGSGCQVPDLPQVIRVDRSPPFSTLGTIEARLGAVGVRVYPGWVLLSTYRKMENLQLLRTLN